MSGMARYARQTIADIPYHIINRGNNHQDIFFRKDDYEFFLESIELAKGKYPCKIYSFILMPNTSIFYLNPLEKAKIFLFL